MSMPASEPAKPNQSLRTQTKPGQLRPTKSSIAYHYIAKQIKQAKQTKQATQSKVNKQAQESEQKSNRSNQTNQTKSKYNKQANQGKAQA